MYYASSIMYHSLHMSYSMTRLKPSVVQSEELSTKREYLRPTSLLDYESQPVQNLVNAQKWRMLTSDSEKINVIYTFVRDRIAYGQPEHPCVPASEVLSAGMGNALTKTTLVTALLRAVGIPCRLRASKIEKSLFQGLLHGLSYRMCPSQLLHCHPEVLFNHRWLSLEGVIIDYTYLEQLQEKYSDYMGSFYGYGIAVLHFRNPPINWEEDHTYIQDRAVTKDLGIFSDPDALFKAFPDAETWSHSLPYRFSIKPQMNRAILKLRKR